MLTLLLDIVCAVILLAWLVCVLVIGGFVVMAIVEFFRVAVEAARNLAHRRQVIVLHYGDMQFLRHLGIRR
jgi:hypothetical protein